jgi:hypothetical protein
MVFITYEELFFLTRLRDLGMAATGILAKERAERCRPTRREFEWAVNS